MDPPDQFSDLVVSLTRTGRLPGSAMRPACSWMTMGDCQFAADWLDTQFPAMGFSERHPPLPRRSSAACEKCADSLRRISFARRSPFTFRFRIFNR